MTGQVKTLLISSNPTPSDGRIRRSNHPNKDECAYCNSTEKKTEEDFLPVWLDGILAPLPNPTTNRTSDGYSSQGQPYKIRKNRQGSVRKRSRVRAVCANCNNVWMSRLQERAKPLVSTLILDTANILDVAKRNLLASWICMTTMSAEFSQPSEICVPREQRLAFAQPSRFAQEPHVPPRDWYIGIARHNSDEWRTKYWHHSARIAPPSPTEEELWDSLNFHTSSVGLGSFFFHVHGSTASVARDGFQEVRDYFSQLGMVAVWPLEKDINWSQLRVLPHGDIEVIAHWQDRVALNAQSTRRE